MSPHDAPPQRDPPLPPEPVLAEEVPPGWNDAPKGWDSDWEVEREPRPITLALGGPSYMIVYVDATATVDKDRVIGKHAFPITRAEARRLYRDLRLTLFSGDEEIRQMRADVWEEVVGKLDEVLDAARVMVARSRAGVLDARESKDK